MKCVQYYNNNNKLNYINLKPQANTFQKIICCFLVDFYFVNVKETM